MQIIKPLLILQLFLTAFSLNAQKFTVNGYVRDAQSGENLIGATVFDTYSQKGAITNIYGFYSLTLPSDSINLVISFVGYEDGQAKMYLGSNQKKDFNLSPGAVLEELVVTAYDSLDSEPGISQLNVTVKQISDVPAFMGEVDVLKSLQLLPGIQGGNEGTSGIYVRGGGPDQNLILIDGVPVYNASHLFGFFSVFNADAINNISVIKGGFPARYGGRLSSVVDISLKEGNNQKLTGTGSIGLLSAKFTLEGPIKSENTSFIFSARRTYIDIVSKPFIRSASGDNDNLGYFFHDFNAKINHRISERDRIYLSFYGGLDKFSEINQFSGGESLTEDTQEDLGLKWGNLISAFRWNRIYSPKLFSNVTATFSQYNFDTQEKLAYRTEEDADVEESINYESGIRDVALKVDFDYLPNPNNEVKFGGMAIHHSFEPGVNQYSSSIVNQNVTFGAKEVGATELAAYFEDDIRISPILKVNAGLHGSMFVTDGKVFSSLQPRLSARLLMGNSYSLKGSYAQMTQFIHLLTNGGVGLPTDLWVPSTELIKPQQSQQIALGVSKKLGIWNVSVETYYKEMNNLIEYEDGASFLNNDENWDDQVVIGDGESYGFELLVEKKSGRLKGWAGYTLSKTTRQFEELNFGRVFPYKYDRRHDISLVSSYQLNKTMAISGTWVYATGNTFSLPVSKYAYFDFPGSEGLTQFSEVRFYEERNNFRTRDYHRLDIGVSSKKEKTKFVRTWTFGAYNIYNRRNPFYVEQRQDRLVQFSLFPIIPYINYKIEF